MSCFSHYLPGSSVFRIISTSNLGVVGINPDLNWDLRHIVELIRLVLLVDWLIVLLAVGVVDDFTDVSSGVTDLSLGILRCLLQNMRPWLIFFEHSARKVNGRAGDSRWHPFVHRCLQHRELTKIASKVEAALVSLYQVAEPLNEPIDGWHSHIKFEDTQCNALILQD